MIDDQVTRAGVVMAYADAPTRTVSAGGVSYAYRELGPKTGVPVVLPIWPRSWTTGTRGSWTASPRSTG